MEVMKVEGARGAWDEERRVREMMEGRRMVRR